MDIIAKNPYRYLGVYSNSPIKERVANRGKINAFLKVGKPVSFPLDFPIILPDINRSTDSVTNAESQLTLLIDQIKFAQYWWMNLTPLDGIAFNHLMNGNTDTAKTLWSKKANVSSLQNNFVLSCVNKEWTSAIHYAEVLYTNFSEEFTTQIVGNNLSITTPLWQMLIDSFYEEKIDIQLFMNIVTNPQWKSYIADKSTDPILDAIDKAVGTAKASRGKGAAVRLQAGEKLMASAKSLLPQLGKILSASDIRYQTVADKLGLEILQCGIDYYNGSHAADAAQKAMRLQSYAESVVIGKMAKDRCKENVDILRNIIRSLPPIEVFTEDKAIKEELQRFFSLPDKICHAIDLLYKTKVHLQSIKKKLGATDAYYLKISTQVVDNALHNVIEEVNSFLNTIHNTGAALPSLLLYRTEAIKSVLESAWKAVKIMDTFDMEPAFKTNQYNKNHSILRTMCIQAGVLTTYIPGPSNPNPTKQSSTSDSNSASSSNERSSGCLSALIRSPGCLPVLIAGIVGCIVGGICVANDGEFQYGFIISAGIVIIIYKYYLKMKD